MLGPSDLAQRRPTPRPIVLDPPIATIALEQIPSPPGPGYFLVDSNSMVDALKAVQMRLLEIPGAWKITGIGLAEPEDPPPADAATADRLHQPPVEDDILPCDTERQEAA